jgi:peptidoglycan hydrolase CwlO-like protein
METLSFILGIAFVVVIVTSIVAAFAFVKVNKSKTDINNLAKELGDIQNQIYKDMNDRTNEIIRMLDSRCDKLENKLTNKK